MKVYMLTVSDETNSSPKTIQWYSNYPTVKELGAIISCNCDKDQLQTLVTERTCKGWIYTYKIVEKEVKELE